jgi:phytoene synthase
MPDSAKEISQKSKSSFYYTFSLLPPAKRDAMNTVYAFCRQTDDIIDEGTEDSNIKYERLRKWRNELEKSFYGHSDYVLLNKLANIINRFNIPIEPFFELIKGVEMDLQKNRYNNIEDLLEYCYRVASTVGLMCIEIFGYNNKSTRNYAINLGLALQLTNILRDVKKDAQNNRIYLPLADIKKFSYSESELLDNTYNSNFVSLMSHEGKIAESYFEKANQELKIEDKKSLFAARAMQHIYFRLLKKLEHKNYDVFSQDINVSNFEKVFLALGVWAKYRIVY